MKICAVVPSLNPDEKLIDVITGLEEKGFERIILVNDGSESDEYFVRLGNDKSVTVLTHEVNKGKGRAMKTAMRYYLDNLSEDYQGLVFCDADNQHSSADILKCAEAVSDNNLVLGVRDFSLDNVPTRSRMGNRTMSFLFKVIGGLSISDTQTGLRAMGNSVIKEYINIKGERFEYETNMLLETKRFGTEITEITIETIYEDTENHKSNFNTIKDSFRIFKILLAFVSSSLISCVVDVLMFAIFIKVFGFLSEEIQIFLATAVARVISSIVNYFINHKAVFKSRSDVKATIWRYYLLCIVQMLFAYLGVYLLVHFTHFNEVLMKLLTDFILFLVSFQIQRDFIFQTKRKKQGNE